MSIEVQGITKTFGSFCAVNNVDLKVETGELVALLGPSGSGKTTLLRMIAGLEAPDAGRIFFHGEEVTDRRAQERRVGFVFQHYALFRHMTIFENVAFGLRVRPRSERPSRAQIRERVMELLRLVQIDWLSDKYPHHLSGGQRQRVALARALAVEPRLLLLDEPFGALDARVRKELRKWLRRLHDELHITSVFITHDQEEALELADRVVVMNEGRVVQMGTPEDVYAHPADLFVYRFLGNVNLFHGRVENGRAFVGDVPVDVPVSGADADVVLAMRPHLMDITREPVPGHPAFRAEVVRILAAGPQVRVELSGDWGGSADVEITQERYAQLGLAKGDAVYVLAGHARVFVAEGAARETFCEAR